MIYLAPDTVVPERLFTHPQHTIYDSRQLAYMVTTLCRLFEEGRIQSVSRPIDITQREPDGRSHRLLLIQPVLLDPDTSRPPFTVVGFFGQRLIGTTHSALQARDDLLVDMMEQQAGLLSYSTLELTCGNFANCVLFQSQEAKNLWGKNAAHREIAREMSPHYYESIRLYNGILDGGIRPPFSLSLEKVKYLDYRSRPAWRAERQLN